MKKTYTTERTLTFTDEEVYYALARSHDLPFEVSIKSMTVMSDNTLVIETTETGEVEA